MMKIIYRTSIPHLERSLQFFERTGFEIETIENKTFAVGQKVIFELNEKATDRNGLLILGLDPKKEKVLKEAAQYYYKEDREIFGDYTGNYIYLKETLPIPKCKDEPTFLGQFAGLTLECIDIQRTQKVYEAIGFKNSMGSIEKGWITMECEGISISLMVPFMCPHDVITPSLSYFNGENNLKIIENIKAKKIPIHQEITIFNKENIVDNVILREPGGYGFFIFSD